MAAIDKTYVSTWEDWKEIVDYMTNFERVLPNGSVLKGKDFLYYPEFTQEDVESWLIEQSEVPVMNTSHTMDYFLIRECPLEVVQKNMKFAYSEETYEAIKNGTSEYDKFVRPTPGKHLRLIKKPRYYTLSKFFWNNRYNKDRYFVHIKYPENVSKYSWYYENLDHWSMDYELIHGGSLSSSALLYEVKSFKALIRKILKWKLPIGTKVFVSHFKFNGGECEFIVKK